MTEPIVKEEPVIETPVVPEPQAPGTQTDPALLLKSLQEEREKRRIAEKEAEDAKVALAQRANGDGEFSDEAKVLLGRISALEGLATVSKEKEVLTGLQTTYPALKDKSADFEKFRLDPANYGMSMSTAAKAFLAENDLLTSPKPRRGVESPAGGGRTPAPTGLSVDDIEDLRVNNYRKYSQMIRDGEIK